MPVRQGAPLGAPTWIDLATSDLDRAQECYGTVFELDIRVGRRRPAVERPDGWTTYLHTADIQATIAMAIAGGAVACVQPVEPMEIRDKGWMGLLTDPTGAFFGLWQPNGSQRLRGRQRGGRPCLPPADHLRLRQGARLLPRGVRLAHRDRF